MMFWNTAGEGKLLKTNSQATHQWTLDVLADMSEYFRNEGLSEVSKIVDDAKKKVAKNLDMGPPASPNAGIERVSKRAKINL